MGIRHLRVLVVFLVIGLCIGGVYLWGWVESQQLAFSYYAVYPERVESPVRAVLLTDLHQKVFGENNKKLLDRIEELAPDLIFIAGDTINSDHPDIAYAVDLCTRLQAIAPVYFGMGNHENQVEDEMDRLEEAGITVLRNSSVVAEVNGSSVSIGAVSTNMDKWWPQSGKFLTDFMSEDSVQCKILLSHFPDPAARTLQDSGIDMVLSGHNHGGVIRLPGIGGLYSDGEGFFPRYDAGMRNIGGTALIISRGVGGHGWVPRLLNPPELVIIDIS